jgi:hypothetical protein
MCLSTMPQNLASEVTYHNTRGKIKHPCFADNMANFTVHRICFIDRGFLQNKIPEGKYIVASVASKPLTAIFLL